MERVPLETLIWLLYMLEWATYGSHFIGCHCINMSTDVFTGVISQNKHYYCILIGTSYRRWCAVVFRDIIKGTTFEEMSYLWQLIIQQSYIVTFLCCYMLFIWFLSFLKITDGNWRTLACCINGLKESFSC